jgi:hypothetical protein
MISFILQICVCALLGAYTFVGLLTAYFIACYLLKSIEHVLYPSGDNRLPR